MYHIEDLMMELLSGKLILDEHPEGKLPKTPLEEFDTIEQYKIYWKSLYKYEMYCRLFSDTDLGNNTT